MSKGKRFQSGFRFQYISISDSFLKYLARSSVSCQQALESELPPPPGLNEIHKAKTSPCLNATKAPPDLNEIPKAAAFHGPNNIQIAGKPSDLHEISKAELMCVNEMHVRPSKDLQLKVPKLRIDSPNKGPDRIPLPLHWWLLVGMGFIALVMMGNLARRRRLMQTQCTPSGLPARHLRLDSQSTRLLAENGTSTGDLNQSEPTSAKFSGYELVSKEVSEAIASGYDQWETTDLRWNRLSHANFIRQKYFRESFVDP